MMFPVQYAIKVCRSRLVSTTWSHRVQVLRGYQIGKDWFTHQCIDSRLFREAAKIARHERHDEGEIARVAKRETGPGEATPFVLLGKLSNEGGTGEGDAEVPHHPQRPRVAEIGAANGGGENQEELEDVGDAGEEQGVKGVEAEAFDDNRVELKTRNGCWSADGATLGHSNHDD